MTRYKNHLIVALSITVVGLKRELLRRNWNFYEYNILLSNEQKWILALGRWDKKERKKEKKNREKRKRNVPFKNIDERSFNSVRLATKVDAVTNDIPARFAAILRIIRRVHRFQDLGCLWYLELAAVRQSAGFSLFFAAVCSKNVVERSRIVRQV